MIFRLNSYHLNWNHTKDRKGKSAIDTVKGARNLDDSSLELWIAKSPKTGTAVKHEDGTVFLDVPTPC